MWVLAAWLCLAGAQVAAADPGPQVFVQTGHTSLVSSVALSSDGRLALSGSGDSTVKLWEVASGREIRTLQGHTGQVGAVAFSPDNRFALSGGEDMTLKLWDLATGLVVRTFTGHTGWIGSVAFSADGKRALSGSRDRTLKLWEVATGRELETLRGHTDAVITSALSRDGRYALSSGSDRDRTIRLWDLASGRELRIFQAIPETIDGLAFSPDGRLALSGGSGENLVRLWDVASGTQLRSFAGHTSIVAAVAFSPDGTQALSGAWDKTMMLWEVATGRPLRTYHAPDWLEAVAFSADGRSILAGTSDNLVTLWDVQSGLMVRTFTGKALPVYTVSFAPDGRSAFANGKESALKRWDLASGAVTRLKEGSGGGFPPAHSPDGKLELSGNTEGNLILRDLVTGTELRTFRGHTLTINAEVFSPDGHYALSASADKTLRLWDVATGVSTRTLLGHTDSVRCTAFSPDGKLALSGGMDGSMKLWDLATGQELRTFLGHGYWITAVAFSPDGRYALSGSLDRTLRLWEVATGRAVRAFPVQPSGIWSAVFSPDGRFVLSGSDDGALTLLRVDTGREVAKMFSFPDGEWVVITPDGSFDASPNGARYVNVSTGTSVCGVDQFYDRFYRPERVRMALAGQELGGGDSITDILATRKAPTVRIVSPAPGTVTGGDSIDLVLALADNGGGIGEASVYLNGAQVANDSRGVGVKAGTAAGARTLTIPITLVDGANAIKVIAFNRDGSMESTPATLTVTCRATRSKPDCYALVVGIDQYRNQSITLKNAVADAAAFAEAIAGATRPLFARTEVRLLTRPEETTREAIIASFDALRGKIKPNDLFVFYDASHGVVDVADGGEQYYLLTSNVLLLSSRHLAADALSQKELGRLIGSIPAQKKVVFLDTCDAGRGGKDIQAALLQQTRGLTDATAVKVLQRAIGSAVFAASSDRQQALEGYQGHGLFTYVLLEGIKGKADARKDGFITVLGLAEYVEEEVVRLSETVFKRQQSPTIETGANFPIGKVR
jgi:WD40 repeat protein